MMNPPPPMRLPPEPDEPRDRPETGDSPLSEADVAETGGRCCFYAILGFLLPSAALLAFLGYVILGE